MGPGGLHPGDVMETLPEVFSIVYGNVSIMSCSGLLLHIDNYQVSLFSLASKSVIKVFD